MKRVTAISLHLQQRINIHFCVKMGWTFDEIKAALQTCYANVLCNTSIHRWIREFQVGRESIVDKPRKPKEKSGHSHANIRKVESLVAQDRRITIKELSVCGLASVLLQSIGYSRKTKLKKTLLNLCACCPN